MPISETTLVQQLLDRKPHAMSAFYLLHHKSLYTIIHRLVRNSESAEDVLQDSLVKIWKGIASFDPLRGSLFSWSARICSNAAVDFLRDKRTRLNSRSQSLHDTPGAYHLTTNDDNTAFLDVPRLLQTLRPEYRQLLELLYLKEYTQVEAAAELGLPLGTVKSWSKRARNLLLVHL